MTAKLVIVVVAALVLIAGLAIDPRSTLSAYLVAWVAIGAIPLGVLCVLMTSYLVRRAWTEALHPIMLSATSVLPILAVLFLPALIGMKQLYPAASAGHALPAFKAVYLAPWFFVLRTVIYFVVLWLLALWQRATWGDSDRMIRSASAGLIVTALLLSFAGVDWVEFARARIPFLGIRLVFSLLHAARWHCFCDPDGARIRAPDRRHQRL